MERNSATLTAFFVFNPTFGPTDETEHEKLLFYYPKDADINQKFKYIGLTEALVNFTRLFVCLFYFSFFFLFFFFFLSFLFFFFFFSFSPNRPCETVKTQRKRITFFNPEPNYWIVMVL